MENPKMLIGPELPQNSSIEKPRATVGITNGMSASASTTLIHRERPRAMIHASGSPARRSKAATESAIVKDQKIAASARASSSGFWKTCSASPSLKVIPRTGGRRMKDTRNRIVPT